MPQEGGEIDRALLNQMVDAFLERGGTYFDTAYTYLNGQSETAFRDALVNRHPRERFQIADKLPSWMVRSKQDCQRYFDKQRRRCGTDYFDVYLLHWLNQQNYGICEKHDEFSFLRELKAQGKVGKIGFSYHDSAALLDEILAAHPETEVVQLQINYLDWDSAAIEGRKCYEVAVKHRKSVSVMEPVRFVQSLPAVDTVLSGMSSLEQILENMEDMAPLTEVEQAVLQQAADAFEKNNSIQ